MRRWHRKGLLSAGQDFTNSWTFGSEPAGTINVRTEPGAVVLSDEARPGRARQLPTLLQECQKRFEPLALIVVQQARAR